MIKKINRVRKECKKSLKRLLNGKGRITDFNLVKTVLDQHFDMLIKFESTQGKQVK